MNLIIFGPPGSGKGTYSQRIAPKLGIVKISTGDIYREIVKNDKTSFGKMIADILSRGELVPDDITNKILEERISQPDAKKGFILDGYPRTLNQAKFLEGTTKIDAIINIIAPEEILIEKISARRVCSNPKCDGNYNIADINRTIDGVEYLLPPLLPKKDMICDKCGSKLYQRNDDTPEVIKERLKIYEKQTSPVIEYYKKTNIPFVNVHMNRPPNEIVEKILEELKKLNLIKHAS
ncbi:MAG: nucleoside monophosphate kinase [Candidatus Aenigmatarchaeota archaeon]|nr:nucleoside monophosphate kinase [Candidatus Aenigmarchaeota archaeon]